MVRGRHAAEQDKAFDTARNDNTLALFPGLLSRSCSNIAQTVQTGHDDDERNDYDQY